MTTWQVAGLGTDSTEDVQTSVKTFISTNWGLTGELAAGRILFSTGWYDKSRQYQIHFKHPPLSPTITPYTLGANPMFRYDDIVTIHVFVTALKANQEPSQLGSINREIERIIGSNTTGLETSKGFCYVRMTRGMNTLPMEDSQISTWHSTGQCAILLHKVNR